MDAKPIIVKPGINWNVHARKFWELYQLFTEVHDLDPALFQEAGSIKLLLETGGAALVVKHHGNKIAAGNIIAGLVEQLERRISHVTLTNIVGDLNAIARDFKPKDYKLCKDPSACDPNFKPCAGDVKICDVCLAYPLFIYYAQGKIELCTLCFQVGSALSNTTANKNEDILNQFKHRRRQGETYY